MLLLSLCLLLAACLALHGLSTRARYRHWLNGFPEAMLVVDQQGVIRYANQRAQQFASTRLAGSRIQHWLPDGSFLAAPVWRALLLARDNQASSSLGQFFWQSDATQRVALQISATALPRDKAVLLVLRRPEEQAPNQPRQYLAEKLLRSAQSDAGIGSWVLHMRNGQLEWSPAVHAIFGTEASQFGASEQAYFACVHPLDRERVRQELDHFMQGGEPFDLEYRIVRPDGQVRHLLERNHVHRQPNGEIDHLWGTVIDMTTLKQLKTQLQLSQLAVEHSSEGMAIADADMQWLYINPALQQMCGLSPEQPAPHFLLPGADHVLDAAALQAMLSERSSWQGELRVHCQQRNSPLPVLVSVTRVADNDSQAHSVWVLTDISRIKESERKLRMLAFFDGLTGLANRTLFGDQLDWHMQDVTSPGLALAFIDLNGFKQINDALGHEAGDLVLCEVAQQLQAACRQGDLVARWGGDEFALLLPGVAHAHVLQAQLQTLRDSVQVERQLDGRQFHVTASIGVAFYPASAVEREQLMHQADLAMYRAKAQGGNSLWLHDGQALRAL